MRAGNYSSPVLLYSDMNASYEMLKSTISEVFIPIHYNSPLMSLFMMRSTAALQSLKRSILKVRNICFLSATMQLIRSMTGCMQRNMQMIMMRFFVMESLSLKNAAL